ncbi:MAG: hypothetical protein SFV52_10480 [Saprospiraceae bacterium]|nr:hypothetical protein [Saprospiraceae bacterium]
MIPGLRQQYNAQFNKERYEAFLHTVNTEFGSGPTFRVAETPVFISRDLKDKLLRAVEDITAVITAPGFIAASAAAIPPDLHVPGEPDRSHFIQLDFGICSDASGELKPMLIELQGFPSLYAYQHMLALAYRKHFDIPADFHHLFGGLDHDGYIDILRQVIVGDEDPASTVLLEIEPEKQNTNIDFWGTRQYLGTPVVCLSQVERRGDRLFYKNDKGVSVPIRRLYNRIIFDDMDKHADLPRQWNMTEPVDVQWTGHPNWFFRISKYTLPSLKSDFVPETHFVHQLPAIPDDLENWVLKPLFSFSGMGVKVDVTREDITSLAHPDQYILQRKVHYAPVIQTANPEDPAKCEIRMMLVWHERWPRPRLVNNLVRMSKGAMVGVRYNMGKDWVGSSAAFFEP